MPLFPCFAPRTQVTAIDELFAHHRAQRSADTKRDTERPVRKHPALAAPYGAAAKHDDPGFDAAGFAFGLATGLPISPVQGLSTGAMLGAALHSNSHAAATPSPSYDPPAASSSSYDTGSSSSSSDSGSSSSSSDSGSSSSGGGDSGGSF